MDLFEKKTSRVCSLDHSALQDPSILKFKAERKGRKTKRRRKRAAQTDAITAEMFQAKTKRRRQMTKKTVFHPGLSREEYAAYLVSEHWNEFKRRYASDPQTKKSCFVCGDENYELHHHTYGRLGHEELGDVVPLCVEHHRATHRIVKGGHRLQDAHILARMHYVRDQNRARERSDH